MSLFNLNPKESPKELFGREQELEDLIRLIRARRWVALIGPRMVGKTSLLKAAGAILMRQNIKVVYVNLWGAKGTNDFLKALARALNEEKSIIHKIKSIQIEGATIGSNGISITLSKKPMATLWDLLDAIGRQKEHYVIQLDEVQELIAISGRLLKVLANLFNTHPNITFVFTGSMFGLMKTLLEPDSTSPLYGRSPAILKVQPFDEEHSKHFLEKGFIDCGIAFSSGIINGAVERLDGIPGWLTLYGNKVCVQRLSHKKALEETTTEAFRIVNDELEHFFQNRDRQAYLAALKAAAAFSSWTEIKGAVSIAKGSLVNDATVYRIIEGLKAAMLLQQEKGRYRVEDPMLRSLLLRSASGDGA
jgi:AAA+ ATPase superfamily predicted ATPase